MKLEDKIKLSKENHKKWIKNLERYAVLNGKRVDETITQEERLELQGLSMPPSTWEPNKDTITLKAVKKKAKAKPKKKPPVVVTEPIPEEIPTFLPTDEVLEIIDAGLIEEIPLTAEEKKALKRQALEAKIAELEAEE